VIAGTRLRGGNANSARGAASFAAAVLCVGATYMFYLQQVDDPDKLGAIILELATDLIR
jgi:hypothetical protein